MLAMTVNGCEYAGGKIVMLRQVAGTCDDIETCPKVFDDGEHAVVQGDMVDAATRGHLHLGPGETAVRLPRRLILDAARRLTENA
jgi:hypothetical protein